MDFEKILPLILDDFKNEGVRYALIGGIAMSAWGIVRATMDLDCLVLAEDLNKIAKIMEKYNYHCVYKTKNVSQYVSDIKVYGSIDFLHAFRDTACFMLQRAQELPVLSNRHKLSVLCLEDIIGLKLQALVNDPKREAKESLDIENIMVIKGAQLDWKLLEEYYTMFDKANVYKGLKEKYAAH